MPDHPQRIQRRRTRGWRIPPNTICVSRPARWGNVFRIGPAVECDHCSLPEVTPALAVKMHRASLERAIATWPSVLPALRDELRGKNLACWCALCPAHAAGKAFTLQCSACAPCHGDTLGEIANG